VVGQILIFKSAFATFGHIRNCSILQNYFWLWQAYFRFKRKAALNMGFYASWADGTAIGISAKPGSIKVRPIQLMFTNRKNN